MKKYLKNKTLIFISITTAILTVLVMLFFLLYKPFSYRDEIDYASRQTGVPPNVIRAVIKAESGFKKDAISPKGAIGLMQILPSTASFISTRINIENFDLLTPKTNILFGAEYLKYLFEKFERSTAFSAYNAGEGRVKEWLKNKKYSSDGRTLDKIPYPETEEYVSKVMRYCVIYGVFT